jgi:hypothetical protein
MKVLFSFVFLTVLFSCHSPARVILNVRNVQMVRLHKDPNAGLMVISDDKKGPMWFSVEDKGRVESLKNIPQVSLHAIEHLSFSPDDKVLAVISVGEGHPYLEIFNVNSILGSRDSESDVQIEPTLAIDPYPGYVWVNGWKGEKLILRSDMPLDHLDKKERRVTSANKESKSRTFYWHIPTDTIEQ